MLKCKYDVTPSFIEAELGMKWKADRKPLPTKAFHMFPGPLVHPALAWALSLDPMLGALTGQMWNSGGLMPHCT